VKTVGTVAIQALPPFRAGLLPPGDYEMSLAELRRSALVVGPDPKPPDWDAPWREALVNNLEVLTQQLWAVGITEIYADGSFAEDKDHPNDIDGYFICDLDSLRSGRLQEELNLLEPDKIWTWDPSSRRRYRGYPKLQLPMWHKYRGELYPHVPGMGWGCGIRDRFGNEMEFPAAFRQSRRDGKPKGIVKIRHGASP
jgi:hypothetical protein